MLGVKVLKVILIFQQLSHSTLQVYPCSFLSFHFSVYSEKYSSLSCLEIEFKWLLEWCKQMSMPAGIEFSHYRSQQQHFFHYCHIFLHYGSGHHCCQLHMCQKWHCIIYI